MTRLDEPVSPADRLASARLTVKAHANGGRCFECTPDGCKQNDWGQQELAQQPGAQRPCTDPHPTRPDIPGKPR